MVRQNVALALEDFGYKVLVVANGDIALAKLADADSADVIISAELKGGKVVKEAQHMYPALRLWLTVRPRGYRG
jgi:DNA-binding response OmpR family regulator